MTRTALIVGAGIGGLSAGIALGRVGWRVRILERADSPRALGFGLGLAPNAIAALRELGVADVMLARGFIPRRAEVRRPDGTVLKRAALPENALGGPMILALRPALHGTLLEATDPEALLLGTDVSGFTETPNGVTLQTSSGDVEGDVLIGADGIGSVIRRALHPTEPPPRSSGIVAVRGAVHGVLHHLGPLDAIAYFGRGIESMMLRASDTGIYWFLSLARGLAPGMNDAEAVRRHLAGQFDATFRAVTGAPGEMRLDELVDRDPLPFWSRGRVTLLGDAAHPLLPQTGQGAAQALVDAVTLGTALGQDSDLARALRAYERARQRTAAALLKRGRRMAAVMKTTNPLACAARDNFVRLVPAATLARLSAAISRRQTKL